MLICLPLEGEKINSLLSVRFEEAKYFLLIDNETKELEIVENLASCDEAVYLATTKRPKVIITGNLLPASFDFLKASGVKIISGVFGQSGKEALENYKKGKLKPIETHQTTVKGKLL
ncbi:MAG: hypothetical protein AUK09_00075 [Parcubacteria group bacterium CG2_30_36_38]|nr:MAG: hypothetical protein AUK09_00075 [Parcubacteria group bacterium CG2_30_36_38]